MLTNCLYNCPVSTQIIFRKIPLPLYTTYFSLHLSPLNKSEKIHNSRSPFNHRIDVGIKWSSVYKLKLRKLYQK